MADETCSMEGETALALCSGMEAIVAHAHSLLTTEILSPTSRGRVEAMRIVARYAIEVATSTRTRSTPVPAQPVRPTRETILVVKDSVAVSALLAGVLRRHGYRVIETLTAERALDRLAEASAPIDLALLDLTTPGSAVDELVDRMRAQVRALPVLFISGQDAREVAARLVDDERTGFIPKPFVVEDLIAAIQDLMDRRS